VTTLTQGVWSRSAGGVNPRNQVRVDGSFVDAGSGETFDCIDPATGTVSVNTVDAYGVPTPFGGVRASGSSLAYSLHAIEHYSPLKTTWNKC
jgi:acyl-CoA reductase-like NAD-dependent aldehyde dehydrogenase